MIRPTNPVDKARELRINRYAQTLCVCCGACINLRTSVSAEWSPGEETFKCVPKSAKGSRLFEFGKTCAKRHVRAL